MPATLSETGLYSEIQSETLAPAVVAYRPQFELWSDGAEKRRWLWLPPDTRIDTSDMDSWIFPPGTKVWKEFRRDGVRVETRLLELGAGDDWIGVAYVWAADQSDATRTPSGASDALGTEHDVPTAGECIACHGGRKSRVLGVSALQLSAPALTGELDLDGLVSAGRLSHSPAHRFEVPGTGTERAALGYLHANCAHCHNQDRPDSDGPRCFDPQNEVDFQLSVDDLAAPSDTATYRANDRCITPGDPDNSLLIQLVSRRSVLSQMPPLATERVDDRAVSLLTTWIEAM